MVLNLLSNGIDHSNHETSFPHKLLLTDRPISRLRKAYAKNSSAKIKFSKTGFLGLLPGGYVTFVKSK